MASQNLLTPESEIHLPRVRTVDRHRSEQRAHAWFQRYDVRDLGHTVVKYLSFEDDKPPAEGSDDTPFIREKVNETSGDSQQVVQEAASFDNMYLVYESRKKYIEAYFQTAFSAAALLL
jgi:hypothetical protein